MRFLTWLLIASVLSSGFIPTGYMPNAGETRRLFTMVICTGYGSQTIAVDNKGQPANKEQQKHNGNKALCAFFLNAHATPPVDSVVQVVLLDEYTERLFSLPTAHPATAVLRKTAPPRAPPLLS